jgi:hypothetical protein
VERPTSFLGSYATPVVWAPEGKATQIVVVGAVELTGYDAATGRRLWWVHGLTHHPTGPPFVVGDSLYTVEPGEGGGWPAFDGVVAQFDPDEDGRITIAHASDDPIWARSFTGMDRHIGNGDGILTREEYAIASNEMMGGGLARERLGGRGRPELLGYRLAAHEGDAIAARPRGADHRHPGAGRRPGVRPHGSHAALLRHRPDRLLMMKP